MYTPNQRLPHTELSKRLNAGRTRSSSAARVALIAAAAGRFTSDELALMHEHLDRMEAALDRVLDFP